MENIIYDDLYRYEGNNSKKFSVKLKYILFVPGFSFIFFFRKANLSKNFFMKILFKIVHRFLMIQTGIQIPLNTKIGRGFRILHFGNIVVNPGTIIGENFNIAQGVLLGGNIGERAGAPRIGNNVVIGANAILLGGINIGDNVLIAPGAFINFDVPSNSIVIGNPGKIISRVNPTAKFIIYPINHETAEHK